MKRLILSVMLALVCSVSFATHPAFSVLLGLASQAFAPTDIADCWLWLDAADTSTVSTNASGYVTEWRGKSAQADSADQIGADAVTPTYGTNTVNGLNVLAFDGSDYLGANYKSTDSQTVFVCAVFVSGQCILGARDSANTRSYGGAENLGTAFRYSVGADSIGLLTGAWGIGAGILSMWNDGSDVYIRGDRSATATKAQSGTGANVTQGYYIGALNSAGTPLIHWAGNICEVVVYRRVLTQTEIETVEDYLYDKWIAP